jgi:hypothetical protein
MTNTPQWRRAARRGIRRWAGGALLQATLIALLGAASAQAGSARAVTLDAHSGCGPALDAASGDCSPSVAAAYGGWSAWSRVDAASGGYELVVRAPDGAITVPQIPERGAPFDVELGPQAGAVVAVYSRCTKPLVDDGCAIYELVLGAASAKERPLHVPGGGSVHEPAIWQDTLVFLRRDRSGGEDVYDPTGLRPDSLFEWQIGKAAVTPLELPTSRGVHGHLSLGPNWPRGMTGIISGLTLNARAIAYVTATASGGFGMSTLWYEQVGSAPVMVDEVDSGAGNVCDPAFLSPVLDAGRLYAYLHDCPAGGGPISDDRFTRYAVGS